MRHNEERVPFQQRRSTVGLASTIGIYAIYIIYLVVRFQGEGIDLNTDFRFWAAVILIAVPVQVVLKIVVRIIFSIINTVATDESEPSTADEMDKLIELKAIRNFSYFFGVGFLVAMVTQVVGMEPQAMFFALVGSLVVGAIVMDITEIFFYRRGL